MKSRIFSLLVAGALVCTAMLCSSCGSSGSKGKQFAKKENDIYKKGIEEFDKLAKSFTVNFEPENYEYRRDAKNEWKTRFEEIENGIDDALLSLKKERKAVLADMTGKEVMDFEKAYYENSDAGIQADLYQKMYKLDDSEEVLGAIARIKPKKPTAEQMKIDLGGRTIQDVKGGYYYEKNKLIKIDDYEIPELRIENVEVDNEKEYTVNLSITLIGKVNAERRFDVRCKVRYLLPEYDDWTIDFIQTSSLSPVSCSTYKDCVSLTKGGSGSLYAENVCDKSLEVFVQYYCYYGGWCREVVVASPQTMTFVTHSSTNESRIEYIMPL